jgi:hypothetical protein
MTPKEKAYQLWNKYAEANILTVGKYSNYRGLTTDHARVCALIAVDEILFALKYDMNEPTSGSIKYWQEVKKEIELL